MNIELTDDQEFFRETAQRFLSNEMPLAAVRELYAHPHGFDLEWWRAAAELGWTSLFVPESIGGGSLSGRPVADAVIIAEEMGRAVAPGPFLPVNVVAAAIAWYGDDAQKDEFLPGLLTGDRIATWALDDPGDGSASQPVVTCVDGADGSIVLEGEKVHVEALATADHVLVTAEDGAGMTNVLVPADAPGVTVRAGRSIDMTRRFGVFALRDVRLPESAVLGHRRAAGAQIERLLTLVLSLQCAEMVGTADRAFEFTLEYGAERYAFGRPILSFQALKHRIADMAVALEGSKAMSDALAAAVDEDRPDSLLLASMAKAYIGEHAVDLIDDCVQITGGMGVTWEHDLHLYSRRATVDRAVFGTPERHKIFVFESLQGAQA